MEASAFGCNVLIARGSYLGCSPSFFEEVFHVHPHICLSYLSTGPKLNDFGRSKFDFLKVISINFDHIEASHGVPDALSPSFQNF